MSDRRLFDLLALELRRNLDVTVLVSPADVDLAAAESPRRGCGYGGAWGDGSGYCHGGGGGGEELLDHLETRREVEREELAFVEELVSRGCGELAGSCGGGAHLELELSAVRRRGCDGEADES